MPTSMENFPLSNVSDGLISYMQHVFGSPEHTPGDYRWNTDDRASKITISGPFVIDKEKPMSAPFIIVERSGFMIDKRVIDDSKGATPNTFEHEEGVLIANGAITVTIGSQVASEASNLANYLLIQMQADRHQIMTNLGFLRNFNMLEVGPEAPVFKESEVKRWEVVLTINTSIQMGWVRSDEETDKFEKFSLRAVKIPTEFASDTGIIISNEDVITDGSANFGYETTSNPQLLESEFSKGWYTVQFADDENKTLYDVVEIIEPNGLRLEKDGIAYQAPTSSSNVEYKLLWNDVHLRIEM